jgi:hypothetical protein
VAALCCPVLPPAVAGDDCAPSADAAAEAFARLPAGCVPVCKFVCVVGVFAVAFGAGAFPDAAAVLLAFLAASAAVALAVALALLEA